MVSGRENESSLINCAKHEAHLHKIKSNTVLSFFVPQLIFYERNTVLDKKFLLIVQIR